MSETPRIELRIITRPGHGFRARAMVVESALHAFRAGQADYQHWDRVERTVIPFWRTVATRLGYRFLLDVVK